MVRSGRRTRLALWCAVALVGCSGATASDAGPPESVDAGPPSDVDAGGGADAGGVDAGDGTDAGDTADAGGAGDAGSTDAGGTDAGVVSAEVAACQAAVDGYLATACTDPSGDFVDRCAWGVYRERCALGRPDALREMLQCFTDPTDCGSFGQPGSAARDCVNAARATSATTASTATLDAYCLRCPTETGCSSSPAELGVPPEALTDAENATALSCVEAAASCDDALGCLAAPWPGLISCF